MFFGEYGRSFDESLDLSGGDPWVVLSYYERVLDRLPHSREKLQGHVSFNRGNQWLEPSIEHVRAKLRPTDIDDIHWIGLKLLDLSRSEGTFQIGIDIALDQDPMRISGEVSGPDEDVVLQWIAILEEELPNAVATARDGLPLPAIKVAAREPVAELDEPVDNPPAERPESSKLKSVVSQVSIQAAGTVLGTIILLVAGIIIALFH